MALLKELVNFSLFSPIFSPPFPFFSLPKILGYHLQLFSGDLPLLPPSLDHDFRSTGWDCALAFPAPEYRGMGPVCCSLELIPLLLHLNVISLHFFKAFLFHTRQIG